MKQTVAVLLLVAFLAQTYASEEFDDSDRHPYVQCKIDLYDCLRLNKKSNTQCLADYKTCMSVLLPTVPPLVVKCKNELTVCKANAGGLYDKMKCYANFAKCMVPTEHPYFQCKIDLAKCVKDGVKDKLVCMKDYKSCMAQLLPTIPPIVSKCNVGLNTCLAAANDYKGKAKCYTDFAKCIKNGLTS
ncbi:uncharacterized protein LOC116293257 [Actinia tenebrosa]|uniref:Uncharacterized protein LOC116293257 n=1 Tax=Actinia tenebrosa TaxID=6105 RepID=A0A6P8HND5_ACTTE|nr:uncharacterized protein LOC116293257 [Actinia tenebrosa]